MLQVEALSLHLENFHLHDASFTVDPGDYFVLLGKSGAGKTLILEMLAGLRRPQSGSIMLDGRNLHNIPVQLRNLGLVYQDHALFPHLNVRRNIAYALPRSRRHEVESLAMAVGAAALLPRRTQTLSLGEAQRVALARTLARKPQILMLDEPLASLDTAARTAMRALLRDINARGQTIIHVTHDYQEALALASHVAVLEDGRVAQVGTPDDVFHHPRSRFVASFVGIRNFFPGRMLSTAHGNYFETGNLKLAVAEDAPSGDGHLMFAGQDVTISLSEPHGSAKNVFRGTIVDCEAVPSGLEVAVDVGVKIHALITRDSWECLTLKLGTQAWISFKSTAMHFVPMHEHTESGNR